MIIEGQLTFRDGVSELIAVVNCLLVNRSWQLHLIFRTSAVMSSWDKPVMTSQSRETQAWLIETHFSVVSNVFQSRNSFGKTLGEEGHSWLQLQGL